MSPLEKVQADALKLSSKERAFLAKCLTESLDQGEEQEIERLWLDEAERRLAACREGTIPARAASEVFADAGSVSVVARQVWGCGWIAGAQKSLSVRQGQRRTDEKQVSWHGDTGVPPGTQGPHHSVGNALRHSIRSGGYL